MTASLSLQRRRWVAVFAALALILCTAMYSAHGLSDRAHGHEHCDLCVHLSGSAGTPAQLQVVSKPLLAVHAQPLPESVVRALRSPLGAHLPRGPPVLPTA